jgi:aspartyl-tRNA(Asn)/glutamyl-tRNA(Gln) amidotransferase subunit C
MISESEVRKIAKLAHLSLTDREVSSLARELSSILDYVRQLEALDTSGIEPMSHVHGSTNVFREDRNAPSMEIEGMFRNTPERSGRFIKVPIIVE